ncbi:hypothetical protein [Pandoraea terrae]|uniref:hypothetical protein n=1 Tax=Pandoraea terrae TaxID=1537710 RepID=UPI00124302C2|nr:hypothetical protein [Pandoraea terrae]
MVSEKRRKPVADSTVGNLRDRSKRLQGRVLQQRRLLQPLGDQRAQGRIVMQLDEIASGERDSHRPRTGIPRANASEKIPA